jgi:hypothetical protein
MLTYYAGLLTYTLAAPMLALAIYWLRRTYS